jgi:PAS domain S-box-containing protein
MALGILLAFCACASASGPSLDISQYAHTPWTARDGYFKGNIYSIAQTPDGYLWLGSEFGLFRFGGVHSIHWQPPEGQQLPDQNINSLLAARDGTLWIGTMGGLASWNGRTLTQYPEIGPRFVESLVEDRDGTVWAGALFSPNASPTGLLCAMRSGRAQCYGKDGTFGIAVPGLFEDNSGTLWVLAQSGLWRWRPGPPVRYETTPVEVTALTSSDDGRPLFSVRGGGLMRLVGEKSMPYPIHDAVNANKVLSDHDVDANKLLRDRDGGLWIGTVERGLIHVHNGRTDVFTQSNGLSGDVILSLFEDHEGNIWVATTGGLDRFRELPVTTVSSQQGLSSDASQSVLATTDGSIWIGSHDGLTRLQRGKISIFRKSSGLPDDEVQSLYEDARGRVWAATDYGLAYFKDGRFIAINALTTRQKHWLHFITGDKAGNLWISEHENLMHLLDERLVEKIPWLKLGHHESAEVLLSGGEQGGVWLGFWSGGGVEYFNNGKVRATYTAADGLGEGHVADLEFDRDGALWAATQDGGASRIKDGHISTLTTRNGLPCNTIHWTMEDDDRSFWLYTGCGLVRIERPALDAWIADPKRTIQMTVWDAADAVKLRSSAASTFGPRAAKSSDGKMWFLTGVGVQVVDPHHLAFNKLAPPVHIEQIVADGRSYWQNAFGGVASEIQLPALTHDLTIDYTALSLVASEKVHFKYKLEGQDRDWREVVNDHEVQYSNLPPRHYRFRLIACNNSGVWNEQGDTLEFSVAPAYYQTNWFRVLCVVAFLALLWAVYQSRIRQLEEQEKKFREAVESMPALAFVTSSGGNGTFVNKGWTEYTGMSMEQTATSGWKAAVHPDDLKRVLDREQAALATGEPFDYETRLRRGADGRYRWFLVRVVPVHDKRGKVVKWCGVAADIEDRKNAEQLQAELAHVNRTGILGELTASIAHEINQPLSGVVSNGEACLLWLAADSPDLKEAREAARRIVRDGTRAGEIISRIRGLVKKSPPPKTKLDLNETVQEVISLMADEAKRRKVTIQTEFAETLGPAVGDRVQLQQVVLNLVINAMDAMHDTASRRLRIVTSNIEPGQVCVAVQDTGVGLDSDSLTKIFDPFYSTKSGMGMGLSISRTIVQNHGGRLWATANEDAGATVQFTLPRFHDGASIA